MKHYRYNPGATLAAATLMVATLAGCRSLPALHYYALEAASPASTPAPASAALLIHVRHVGLPREMDHLGLTHHIGPTHLPAALAILDAGAVHQFAIHPLSQDLTPELHLNH